ncbi:MAG: hypothetical protein V4538_17175 [Bacteroidota bacterium]
MKKIITLIIGILILINAKAQFGPNLTTGAGGLAYKQGQLDAQLILDIISTKQGEIKTELGKRLILNKLERGSYAFYQYVEKSINLLFNENNKQVVSKEFMENSAELLLVYGLAEYLLQDMSKKGFNNFDSSEKELFKLFLFQIDSANAEKLKEKFKYKDAGNVKYKIAQNKIDGNSITLNNANSTTEKEEPKFDKYLLKPELLLLLTNKSDKKYQESNGEYFTALSMFVDLIYDVCIRNEQVTSTGLFQSENNQNPIYDALSKYKYFKGLGTNYIYNTLNNYGKKADTIVTFLFSYYNIFKDIKNLYEDSNKNALDSLFTNAKFTSADKLKDQIEKLKFNVTTIDKSPTNISNNKELFEMEKKVIEQIQNMPKYFVNIGHKNNAVWAKKYSDLSYTIQKEILPVLATLNNERNGQYVEIIKAAIAISDSLYNNSLHLLNKDKEKLYYLISSLRNYLPLLDIINNLDRVESYDYMFKFLTGLGETYGDERTKAVVTAITTSVDKYTLINKQDNNIKIDVEGIATGIYNKFAKNQHSRFSLFFTVGANHNVSTGNNLKFISSNGPDKADSLPYSSFISEKIGLKWNIKDWNRSRSFNHGIISSDPKLSINKAAKINSEPIVNNFHMLLYGSGLLYQITVLNSADKFTTPIIGTGLGITFFNGLDFNVSYAVPYSLSPNKGFVSISFDIAIFEYLSALNNKK